MTLLHLAFGNPFEGAILFFLILLQFGLLLWSLISLLKNATLDFATKVLWAIAIFLFPIVGPVLFLFFRREKKSSL